MCWGAATTALEVSIQPAQALCVPFLVLKKARESSKVWRQDRFKDWRSTLKGKLLVQIASFIVMAILAVPIIALLYLVISPDYEVLIVKSESMKPTFNMGDVIVLKTYTGGEIQPDRIIAFDENGFTITHRALSIQDEVITTKGDAVADVDPWEIHPSQVKGTYMFKIPFLGYVAKFFRSKTGSLASVIFASLFLIGLVISEFFVSKKGERGCKGEKVPSVQDEAERKQERKMYWV